MAAQRQAAEGGAGEHRSEHFVIVFPGYNRPWAAWIARRLEVRGHTVTLHRWNPPRDEPLEHAFEDLLLSGGRVVLVLSDWFFQLGPRREGEWNDVLRGFLHRNANRFAAVTLTNRPLPPATAALQPVDLWAIGAEEAEWRLLTRLGLPPDGPVRERAGSTSRYPNDPPVVWGEVPLRNARFTGRDDLLLDLQQRLGDARPGTAVCALVGMSGIGKTQLAAEYAHRFGPDYDVVWWVPADLRGTLRERYGELAPELGLVSGSEPGERIRVLREALRRGEPHGRWLLVFDGWDELEGADALLPHGPGHVLVTSRNRDWGRTTDVVDVPGFARHESTAYLLRRAPHVTADEAEQVAAEYRDVPLSLAQAAALLGESRMPVAEYLRMVRDGTAGHPGRPGLEGFSESSLTSWAIMINRLRAAQPQAVELLTLATCFAPGRIPIGLVHGIPQAELPEGLAWIATDPAGWTRAVDALVTYSVLTRDSRVSAAAAGKGDPGPGHETIHMHRLVHSILLRLTAPEERDSYRRVVRRLLAEADPGQPLEAAHWPRYAELLPHLEPSGALTSTNTRVQNTVLNCLRYCLRGGEFELGGELAERVREHWSEFLAPDAKPMLDLTTQQGSILRSSGRFQTAHALDRALLERLREAQPGDEHALMTASNCLAQDLHYLGHYAEAHQMQREVLRSAMRLLGPDDYTTLSNRHNVALALRQLGRYADAYEMDVETLRRREALLRARHAATLFSGTACARDLRLMGRYRDALARQELGMRLHVQVLGAQHPQTLGARHNLVMCERRAGSPHQEVGRVMASLLEQFQQVYGRGHYQTAVFLTDYGNYLREHGDLGRARALTEEAAAVFTTVLGAAHPITTGMMANTGLVLQAAGDRSGAMGLFEAAYAGLSATLGPDHPWALCCALNAARGRYFNDRFEDAAELSRDTLRRTRHALGEDHPMTLTAQTALAADLRSLRERAEADKQEEDALQRLTRTLGAQHPHTLSARQRVRPSWDFEAHMG
ncbi:FxSxx-COOH system tetratricopeptide repeat protein [Streptomyces sp. TRM 70351]|uniref:FxSxx-COOH system tetratricopeptide repeat protein n=1 Tax=Streptomyces sp. TRM 70351 TaxID=3116552 RepID=UPI002E7AAF36|nr:FxSxx-COOH system tetratricopeptide repeat protein [Streptomyces sp. TRM 70351]MEE1927617.1 FxSxx-COOH system tetratricopeptide repeat protein [Streptomyces sp. TRM 70351]